MNANVALCVLYVYIGNCLLTTSQYVSPCFYVFLPLSGKKCMNAALNKSVMSAILKKEKRNT